MPTVVIVGALWGDEAKGKLVDVLAENADFNVRYSGGNNAGHTVCHGGKVFKFHLIPAGVLHSNCVCVVGGGTVVCPPSIIEEIAELEKKAPQHGEVLISSAAHLVMPYHRTLDELEETFRGEASLGTTRRGIGPAYQDKTARIGIRMSEFVSPDVFSSRLSTVLDYKNRLIEMMGGTPISLQPLLDEYLAYAEILKDRVVEAESLVSDAVFSDKRVIFEGAQGSMLDLDYGSYPYVTSSHPVAGGACIGTGLPPNRIDQIIGVSAAYATRVGAGPFPSELNDETGEKIRIQGNEFGTTTGRARRCGWLDLVALRYSSLINGFTGLAITRLDVLSGFEKIGLCVAYDYQGQRLERMPTDLESLSKVKPVFEELSGWQEDLSVIRKVDELPEAARMFLSRVEECVGVPIQMVSVGPSRDETIFIRENVIW